MYTKQKKFKVSAFAEILNLNVQTTFGKKKTKYKYFVHNTKKKTNKNYLNYWFSTKTFRTDNKFKCPNLLVIETTGAPSTCAFLNSLIHSGRIRRIEQL